MGTGAVKAEKSSESSQAAGPQVISIMSCEVCSTNFTFFKKKKLCAICKRHHCSSCLSKIKLFRTNQRQCGKCCQISTGSLSRTELMKFRVKDLRLFLLGMRVVINNCTEKNDLVELVLKTLNSTEYNHNELESKKRAEELRSQLGANLEDVRIGTNVEPMETEDSGHTEVRHGVQPKTNQPSTSSEQAASPGAGPQNAANHQNIDRLRKRQQQEMQEAEERLRREFAEDQEPDLRPANKRAHINDVSEREAITTLTIKQLKEILATNFINYKGCCEKYELVERVKQLWDEKQRQSEKGDIKENELCKICMDSAIDCVLLDCGHMVTCTQCGKRLNECPICRQYVVRVVHTFKA